MQISASRRTKFLPKFQSVKELILNSVDLIRDKTPDIQSIEHDE